MKNIVGIYIYHVVNAASQFDEPVVCDPADGYIFTDIVYPILANTAPPASPTTCGKPD